MRLNLRSRALIVEALRSDEFGQTTGALRDEDGYCCLGVACEAAIEDGVEVLVTWNPEYGKYFFSGADGLPPQPVEDWAFDARAMLAERAWEVEVDWSQYPDIDMGTGIHIVQLTELNDTYHLTFAQIADLIEADGVRQEAAERKAANNND